MICNCQQLGRAVYPGEMATTHAPSCPAREKELRDLLQGLCDGIAFWGSEEDGVIDEVWEPFFQARLLLGEPVEVRGDG